MFQSPHSGKSSRPWQKPLHAGLIAIAAADHIEIRLLILKNQLPADKARNSRGPEHHQVEQQKTGAHR